MLQPRGERGYAGSLVSNDARCLAPRTGMTIVRPSAGIPSTPRPRATPMPQCERDRSRQRRAAGELACSFAPRVEWQLTRPAALQRDGHRCTTRGASEKLEVHHVRPLRQAGDPFDRATSGNSAARVTTGRNESGGRLLERASPHPCSTARLPELTVLGPLRTLRVPLREPLCGLRLTQGCRAQT